MSALEQALGGPAIEVVAKATRRRFTVEYLCSYCTWFPTRAKPQPKCGA